MRPAPVLPSLTDRISIRPWPDEVIDAVGHDPRSAYVETYWLGLLGPSTTWLLRLLARTLEAHPAGCDLALEPTAAALGLGGRGGRNSPFTRSLVRLVQFEVAQLDGDGALAVRRRLPPLNRRQVARLPEHLQAAHEAWQQAQLETPAVERLRQRSRQLALSLFELGEDTEAVERQLHRWRYHPAMAREATAWALARFRAAADHPSQPRHTPDPTAA